MSQQCRTIPHLRTLLPKENLSYQVAELSHQIATSYNSIRSRIIRLQTPQLVRSLKNTCGDPKKCLKIYL